MSHFYCFVRTDLPLGDQCVQAVHAAIGAATLFKFEATCEEHDCQNLVLLAVPDEKTLDDIAGTCHAHDIKYFVHSEPDDDFGECSLVTEPLGEDRRHLRKLFAKLPLWTGAIAAPLKPIALAS